MSVDGDLPQLLGGRYRLEATLGHGGMGVVYRGVDLTMQRPVAVKLIRAVDGVELDDQIAGRFLREAKNTARLQHEHIIEVFDLGRSDEGGLYLVMELLEGEPLSDRLRRQGRISPETTVHIGRQICDALSVAHAAGVIHRDLKPANVMLLSRAGDNDFVKVLDFGVAKSTTNDQDPELTHTGMLVGTVDYMAPEQILGKPVDGRADVYALGVVLYKMLSGKAPFRDTGIPALIHAHLNAMPKPLIEVATGIPNELDHVVLRCLAKSPDRRFESMAELGRALVHAVMPDSNGMFEREYGGRTPDDLYTLGDETAVARSFVATPPPAVVMTTGSAVAGETLLDDTTVAVGSNSFDITMVRIERPVGRRPPATPRVAPIRAPSAAAASIQQAYAPFPLEDEDATRTLEIPGELRPSEPKICAMCQSVNAPRILNCVACGVSLAAEDQAAVFARMRAAIPRAASPAASMPPPHGDYRIHGPAPSFHPNGRHAGTSSLHAPDGGWGAHQASSPRPRSMWQRFLVWTGLRSR